MGEGGEADFEAVASTDADADGFGGWSGGAEVVQEGAGDNAGAAGEGLGFDAAFVGADEEFAGAFDLDEVGVGSTRGKGIVVTESRAETVDVGGFQIFNKDDCMGDAGVEEMDFEFRTVHGEEGGGAIVRGVAHGEFDMAVLQKIRTDESGLSFEGNGGLCGAEKPCAVAGETTRAVAAHFGLAAVAVMVAHPEVGTAFGGFDREEAIGSDAAVAVAEMGDGFPGKSPVQIAVVEQDEIVARTVHFCERKLHGDQK